MQREMGSFRSKGRCNTPAPNVPRDYVLVIYNAKAPFSIVICLQQWVSTGKCLYKQLCLKNFFYFFCSAALVILKAALLTVSDAR